MRMQKKIKEEEQFHNDYGIRIVSGTDPSCKELKNFVLKELKIDSLPVFVFLDKGNVSCINTGIMNVNSFSKNYKIAYEDKEVLDSYRWKQVLGKQIDLSVKDLNGKRLILTRKGSAWKLPMCNVMRVWTSMSIICQT